MAKAKRGRPKKVQSPEVTEKVTEVRNEVTKVEPLKVTKQEGRFVQHLVYVDGQPRYYTDSAMTVLLRQNSNNSGKRDLKNIEWPKGSQYDIPDYLKGGCNGCG